MKNKFQNNYFTKEDIEIFRYYFPDIKVFIYGSLAQGIENFKDIDLIVVSSMFSETVGIKRTQITCEVLRELKYIIDPICLTPEEFQRFLAADNIFACTVKESLYQIM
jgi:predicted nucleotidyltransferase